MVQQDYIYQIIEKLKDSKSKESVAYLVFSNLGRQGGSAVAKAVGDCARLRKLNLSKNHFDAQSIEPFLKVFAEHHGITDIVLSDNNLGHVGLKFIVDALLPHPALRLLDLSLNQLGGFAVKPLSELLRKSSTLQYLYLAHNQLDKDFIASLSSHLRANRSLKVLDLSHNPIGDLGCNYLSSALRMHPTIEKLILSNANITDKGAVDLTYLEEGNKNLKVLDLSLNQISNVGIKLVSQLIRRNGNLVRLDLQQNAFDDEAAKLLFHALQDNKNLHYLLLSGNNISPGILKAIEDRLETNRVMESGYFALKDILKKIHEEKNRKKQAALFTRAAPTAFKLGNSNYRDSKKILNNIHDKLNSLNRDTDPVASWVYLSTLSDFSNDVRYSRIHILLDLAKIFKPGVVFYEKALLLLSEIGHNESTEALIYKVLTGLYTSRNILTEGFFHNAKSMNLMDLIGAKRVVSVQQFVEAVKVARGRAPQLAKSALFNKACFQPSYLSASDLDKLLESRMVHDVCVEHFGTASIVTFEHLLVTPEATSLNSEIFFKSMRDAQNGKNDSSDEAALFSGYKKSLEKSFESEFLQYFDVLKRALTVFYNAEDHYDIAREEKYETIIDIYRSNLSLTERVVDLTNYLLICNLNKKSIPWASSQLEFMFGAAPGEGMDSLSLIARADKMTSALLGDTCMTRWQSRRFAMMAIPLSQQASWQDWSPWHLWQRSRLEKILEEVDAVNDPKERYAVIAKTIDVRKSY